MGRTDLIDCVGTPSEGEVDQQTHDKLVDIAAIVDDRAICGVIEQTVIASQGRYSPPFTECIGIRHSGADVLQPRVGIERSKPLRAALLAFTPK